MHGRFVLCSGGARRNCCCFFRQQDTTYHARVLAYAQIYLFLRPREGCEVLQTSYLYLLLSGLSVRSHIPKVARSKFTRLLYVLFEVVAWSFSDDNAIRNALPVLWMTSRFHIMAQIQIQTASELLAVTPRQVATGTKSAVVYLLPTNLWSM